MVGISELLSNPAAFLVSFLALIVSIGVHEFSHVLSAYLQGDRTGKDLGRLTLNPLAHLDMFGTVAMVLVGIGWGKPAPFNPYNLRFRRWGSVLVAIAGPISNLTMVAIAGYAYLLIGPNLPSGNLLALFLQSLIIINAALAVFNLIPVPPLDGSHVLRAVVGPTNPLVELLDRYGAYGLLALLLLDRIVPFLSLFISGGIQFVLRILGLGGI